MKRLPIVLSVMALLVALLGMTSLGQATRDLLPFAKNADRVDMLHASKLPKAGQLYPLGTNAKFPAKVLSVSRGPAGPKGATGPAGPAGPRGATGPAGPVRLRYVASSGVTLHAGERQPLSAWCPSGEYSIGGGVSPSYPDEWVTASYPAPVDTPPNPNGWIVWVKNASAGDQTFYAYAICTRPESVIPID